MIILASSSPRRKEILSSIIKDYKVIPSNIDEQSINIPRYKKSYPEMLAVAKATDVSLLHPTDIVIGSDTIVYIDNMILGKPKDYDDAYYMLKLLSNRTHQVITGVSIIKDHHIHSFTSIAKVRFKRLSNQEIIDYIKTNEPMDKAGAYAVQGIGSKFIKKIKGDFYTVMGLPKEDLIKKLKELEII